MPQTDESNWTITGCTFVEVRTADQRTAAAMDAELEKLAATAQRNGIRDARWNKLALALRGVRQFTRPLMHDDDRRKS